MIARNAPSTNPQRISRRESYPDTFKTGKEAVDVGLLTHYVVDTESQCKQCEWECHQVSMQVRIQKSEKWKLVDRFGYHARAFHVPPMQGHLQRIVFDNHAPSALTDAANCRQYGLRVASSCFEKRLDNEGQLARLPMTATNNAPTAQTPPVVLGTSYPKCPKTPWSPYSARFSNGRRDAWQPDSNDTKRAHRQERKVHRRVRDCRPLQAQCPTAHERKHLLPWPK